MVKIYKALWLFLAGSVIVAVSGCETGKQKSEAKQPVEQKTEITNQLITEHNDLLNKANQEIHNINDKLTLLNEKIHIYQEKGKKLTAAQNKEIDEIESIRGTINPRIHEINSISQEKWESFKTSLVKDIDEVKSRIDKLVGELSK